MNESLNLCLSCGLCCNGTLIGFVKLDREEIPAVKELIDIELDDDQGFFLQPCNKLRSTGCSIYSQRPNHCDKFNCGLLKSYEQKELDFDSALEVIDMAKQKRNAIEKKLETLQLDLQPGSFYFRMRELKTLLQKKEAAGAITQNLQELKSDLDQLNELVFQKFGLS